MRSKAAVRLHTLLDLRGNIPAFIRISTGKMHEVRVLDELPIERGAFYVMDKAYIDFSRLYRMHRQAAFFVTRHRKDHRFTRQESRPVEKTTGVRSDQTIRLSGTQGGVLYPEPLRRVSFYDTERKKKLVFITNNLELSPVTIAMLYRKRWQVELFFKWIKQHLRIKAFLGTSENAVKTQIWIAVCTYVLIAIVKKRLKLSHSLYEILQILSLTMFETTPINQLLPNPSTNSEPPITPIQGVLL
jgi:IS4 transposase